MPQRFVDLYGKLINERPRRLRQQARGVDDLRKQADMAKATCSVDGCGKYGTVRRGYCDKHYTRWRMHGDTETCLRVLGDHERRFLIYVDKNGPIPDSRPGLGQCWLWTGGKTEAGYGCFWTGNRLGMAHRWSYEHHVGLISDGLHIDHLCRTPACVNPAHLEPVTVAENTRRGVMLERRNAYYAALTHCPSGHPYDQANTYIRPDGRRTCKTCRRARERRSRAKS